MLFNNFCLWMSICALLVKIQPGKVVWWCADGDFLAILCIVSSASRMQHISHVHPKFALRPHHVWKYGRHAIFDGWEQAKKHRKKKPQGKNIMLCRIPDGDHKTKENADVYVMSNICIDHTCAQQERLNFWLLLKPTCVIALPAAIPDLWPPAPVPANFFTPAHHCNADHHIFRPLCCGSGPVFQAAQWKSGPILHWT